MQDVHKPSQCEGILAGLRLTHLEAGSECCELSLVAGAGVRWHQAHHQLDLQRVRASGKIEPLAGIGVGACVSASELSRMGQAAPACTS